MTVMGMGAARHHAVAIHLSTEVHTNKGSLNRVGNVVCPIKSDEALDGGHKYEYRREKNLFD